MMAHKIWYRILPVCLAVASPLMAQTIDDRYAPIYVHSDDPRVFHLIGPIDIRTPLNFQRAVSNYGAPSELRLKSPGGSVHAGLSLALEVHRLGITTVVQSGCYSACFFAFAAGKTRRIEGELGVHQITSEDPDLSSGQVAISDILDVLDTLGVNPQVAVTMLRIPPEDMYVFSDEEIDRLGLSTAPRNASKKPTADPLERALAAVTEHNSIWSHENSRALTLLSDIYDENVEFYGKNVSRDVVLAEKRRFAARWPERDYRFRAEPSRSSCLKGICTVVGEVDWYAHSADRAATSTGTAEVTITLREKNSRYVIIGEHGHVIHRQ